jgi:general stress protein 26
MPAPPLPPISPAELVDLAREVIREARFPQLATIDGDQPRLRPVSPVRVDGFVIHIANLRSYHKTVELAANPRCELCYVDDRHNQVRLTGTVTLESDRAVLEQIWNSNPLLRSYLGSLESPALLVYRFVPVRVRYMREWALEYYEVPLAGA